MKQNSMHYQNSYFWTCFFYLYALIHKWEVKTIFNSSKFYSIKLMCNNSPKTHTKENIPNNSQINNNYCNIIAKRHSHLVVQDHLGTCILQTRQYIVSDWMRKSPLILKTYEYCNKEFCKIGKHHKL